MRVLKKWDRVLFVLFYFIIPGMSHAHEPWLVTPQQMLAYKSMERPELFTTPGYFNLGLIALAAVTLIIWIVLNAIKPEANKPITEHKRNMSLLALRIGLGTTLILLSLGLIPRLGNIHFAHATLFAPEFLLSPEDSANQFLFGLQLTLGITILLGLMTRPSILLVNILLVIAFIKFGHELWLYAGFYFAISLVLVTQGAGRYSLDYFIRATRSPILSMRAAMLGCQLLTGFTIIYSAIAIKYSYPNIDIGMLKTTNAFTLGIPYDYFTFIMLVVEISFGIAIILGYRLAIVASLLLSLFIILSIDLSENLLAHNFIYGILVMFVLIQGSRLLGARDWH